MSWRKALGNNAAIGGLKVIDGKRLVLRLVLLARKTSTRFTRKVSAMKNICKPS